MFLRTWQWLLRTLRSWFGAGKPSEKRTVQRRPRLESLEERQTPAAVNDIYVASLYHGLLGRDVETAGLTFWTVRLNTGTSRPEVVRGIESSAEFLGRELQLDYQTLLGRNLDPAGLNFFGQALRGGASAEQVKAAILGSDEFAARSGGSVNGFLSATFNAEVGRAINAFDQTFFSRVPNSVSGRGAAALQILTSPEATRVRVNSVFEQVLGRPADANGLAFWTGQIAGGATDADVVAGIAGSTEYFARLQNFPGLTAIADPNAAAVQYLASRGLFNGVLPGVDELAGNIATNPNLIVPPGLAAVAVVPSPTAIGALQGTASSAALPSGTIYQATVNPPAFTATTVTTQGTSTTPAFTTTTATGQATFVPPAFSAASLFGQQTFTSPTYTFAATPTAVAIDPNYINSGPVSPFA